MIDLATIRSLRAVNTHGSVVAAADALGFTPSAISQQVKRLEHQTGVKLLERVGRGVILTTHGRQLIEGGTRLLGDLEQLESELRRNVGTVTGHLRVAAFSTAMRGIVASATRQLVDAHPDLKISLVEREPWDTVDLVATGQHDIGVVHTWGDVPIDVPDHLKRVSIARDVADVIAHRSHRIAAYKTVTPHDLIDEAWVATPDGTICRQWLNRMYDGTGRRPQIAHESLEFESHLAIARSNLGIALVPRLGRAPLGDQIVAVSVSKPVPSREVVAVYRHTMADSPAVQAILDRLAS